MRTARSKGSQVSRGFLARERWTIIGSKMFYKHTLLKLGSIANLGFPISSYLYKHLAEYTNTPPINWKRLLMALEER